jgi:RNA polymerase sigma-70 factor, ECF subfamily
MLRPIAADLHGLGAPAPADGVLLARVRAGEEAAFRALVARHCPRLIAVARRMLGGEAEAEDVAQETLVRLWRNRESLDVPADGLGGWLYRVTSNLCLDRLRARRPSSEDGLDTLTVPPEQGRDLEQRQLAARVDQSLQQLPERQRLALVLCHYEGLDMASAGDILGVSVEAVESLLARARRTLKASLAAEWRSLIPDASEG